MAGLGANFRKRKRKTGKCRETEKHENRRTKNPENLKIPSFPLIPTILTTYLPLTTNFLIFIINILDLNILSDIATEMLKIVYI
jgi:hypothetical protein